MRFSLRMTFLFALLAACCPATFASPASPPAALAMLDHVLLWGRSIDQVTSVMTARLGFQVVPGRNPTGVANRYIRMADGSYIELLGITRSDAAMDPGMLADQASLHGGAGARTFGLRTHALELRREQLAAGGFAPTDVFSASADDPDGDGPGAPPRWRLFAFQRDPLSSHLFFIDYAVLRATPAREADTQVARRHPNGAQAVTAFWLLSADAGADRDRLARMGFAGATPIRFPQLAARGYCIPVDGKRLLALQPDGEGIAADALRTGGSQVIGVDVSVMDVDLARRRVARGYETDVAAYDGLFGRSFLAPSREDLGMLVEFHAAQTRNGAPVCPVGGS
ncbi:VOC family protein [Frateuria sp. GZRR35]|uniref:VOC family protein n=2 Tax=unclassified Frateuria TaxID=2648894 RepID=UPI003EDB702A